MKIEEIESKIGEQVKRVRAQVLAIKDRYSAEELRKVIEDDFLSENDITDLAVYFDEEVDVAHVEHLRADAAADLIIELLD